MNKLLGSTPFPQENVLLLINIDSQEYDQYKTPNDTTIEELIEHLLTLHKITCPANEFACFSEHQQLYLNPNDNFKYTFLDKLFISSYIGFTIKLDVGHVKDNLKVSLKGHNTIKDIKQQIYNYMMIDQHLGKTKIEIYKDGILQSDESISVQKLVNFNEQKIEPIIEAKFVAQNPSFLFEQFSILMNNIIKFGFSQNDFDILNELLQVKLFMDQRFTNLKQHLSQKQQINNFTELKQQEKKIKLIQQIFESIQQSFTEKQEIAQKLIQQQNTDLNLQKQFLIQSLYTIELQKLIENQIFDQKIETQISILKNEIVKLDNDQNLTNHEKEYIKNKFQQQLFEKLIKTGKSQSIPHVKQNIQSSNPELAIFVLKESLLRDQKRILMKTSKQYSFGFDSIVGAFGQGQSCFKVTNKELHYDKIINDNNLLYQHILEFKQKLSSSLKINTDKIQILGVSKGSFEISFTIIGKSVKTISQEIQNNPNAIKFLDEYCNGRVEYAVYFNQASNYTKGVTLSSDDFDPVHNMTWYNDEESEKRGPPDYIYDYYFPVGCFGFGLNIDKYGENKDWIKMNGNPNEWRILYHGTYQPYTSQIIQQNLKPGSQQACVCDTCVDEFGQEVEIGTGIYFSDKHTVCIDDGYAKYTQIGDKEFAPIFQSRVNPKKVRQGGPYMIEQRYFVVNNSIDVRPYRILIHEKEI